MQRMVVNAALRRQNTVKKERMDINIIIDIQSSIKHKKAGRFSSCPLEVCSLKGQV